MCVRLRVCVCVCDVEGVCVCVCVWYMYNIYRSINYRSTIYINVHVTIIITTVPPPPPSPDPPSLTTTIPPLTEVVYGSQTSLECGAEGLDLLWHWYHNGTW